MNKNELRLGNLVNEEILGNCEVSDICEHVVMVKVNNGELDGTISKVTYTLNYCCINPIPLNEKLLLDFGFKKLKGINDRYLKDYGAFFFSLLLTNDDKSYDVTLSNHDGNEAPPTVGFGIFKYVHQLQNIYFALCSEELKRVDGF